MPVSPPQPAKPGYRIDVRWTWRSAIALRTQGVRGFLIKALGETVYRRLLVFERRLDGPRTGPSSIGAPSVVCRGAEVRVGADVNS